MEQTPVEYNFRLDVLRTSAIWIGALTAIGVIARYSIAPFNLYTSTINFACGLILLTFPYWLKKKAQPKILATVFLLLISAIGISSAFGNGGIAAPTAMVFILIPVIGFLLNGRSGGAIGLSFTIASVLAIWLAERHGFTNAFSNPDTYSTTKVFLFVVTSIGAYFLGRAYEKSRKAVESELINREEQIRAILESSPVAKILVEESGKIAFFNKAVKSLVQTEFPINASPASTPGSVFDLLPEELHPRIKQELTGETNVDQNLDIQFNHGDEAKWVRIQAVKLEDGHGTIRILFIFFDMTEQKRIEEMRFAMIANSKMAALGEMAGGVAHEINNPLSIIVGKCRTIRSLVQQPDLNREKVAQELEKIAGTAGRIAKITTGLLAFSRSGEQDPPQKTFVREIVEETLAFCFEKFKARDVLLGLAYEGVSEITVKCRQSQISQVLVNLLNNALDEVETHPQKWVRLDVARQGENIEFSVTDSGSGIPADVVEKLFQPFFTTKAVGHGTGLGLSISKGLIESHNGTIKYDPKSANTRFVVSIPIEAKND